MPELVDTEALTQTVNGIVKFISDFTPPTQGNDFVLHEPVSDPQGNTWQLQVDRWDRLSLKYHSGQPTAGHAPETSTRDNEYHRKKSLPDNTIDWRNLTYPHNPSGFTDESIALQLAQGGITPQLLTAALTNHVS